jgi:hypothetical protein
MEDHLPRSLCVSFIRRAVGRLLITKYSRRVHGYTAHFARLVYHNNWHLWIAWSVTCLCLCEGWKTDNDVCIGSPYSIRIDSVSCLSGRLLPFLISLFSSYMWNTANITHSMNNIHDRMPSTVQLSLYFFSALRQTCLSCWDRRNLILEFLTVVFILDYGVDCFYRWMVISVFWKNMLLPSSESKWAGYWCGVAFR